MSEKHYEYCFLCDRETGRAGADEDSLFCDACHDDGDAVEGPYCEECWKAHERGHEIQKGLDESQLTAANERIAKLEAGLNEIHGEIGYYLEHDRELLEKISALKDDKEDAVMPSPSFNSLRLRARGLGWSYIQVNTAGKLVGIPPSPANNHDLIEITAAALKAD